MSEKQKELNSLLKIQAMVSNYDKWHQDMRRQAEGLSVICVFLLMFVLFEWNDWGIASAIALFVAGFGIGVLLLQYASAKGCKLIAEYIDVEKLNTDIEYRQKGQQ